MGQYACLGKNLAYQELRLFMATVVRHFDYGFAPGFNVEAEFDNKIRYKGTLLINRLPMVFTPRT